MKTSLIAIGNSRGVRIPKAFLEQAGLHGDVVIRAAYRSRAGWADAFRRMASMGDDGLLDAQPTRWSYLPNK